MQKILWVDLETTGLDVHGCCIVEIGAIITNNKLEEIATFQTVIYRTPNELAVMDDYVRRMHTNSGLLKEIQNSAITEYGAETDFNTFISEHFEGSKAIIAGSSVYFDKKFLDEQMETTSKKLHYRIIDVSSFKETLRIFFDYEISLGPPVNHRAMDDIRGSIREFGQYLKLIKIPERIGSL